jgi:hypothetical protein
MPPSGQTGKAKKRDRHQGRDDQRDRRPLHTLGDIGILQSLSYPRHEDQGHGKAGSMTEMLNVVEHLIEKIEAEK